MKKHIMLMLAMAALALPAAAQDFGGGPRMMPWGDGVLVSLSAQARKSVSQDRVQVTMGMEQEGKSAAEVQNAINRKMQAAQKIYAKYKDVKVSTAGYNVWKNYSAETVVENGKVVKKSEQAEWRGNQQLVLQGDAKSDALKLMGELQAAGFAAQGMNYYLSTEAQEKLTDELVNEALGKISARARKVAAALGTGGGMEYVWVNTSGSAGYTPPMPMRMMAMAKGAEADMAAPVGQAGESEVVVTVDATVKLKK